MKGAWRDLWKNINSGVAFALFLRRGTADFRCGIDQLAVLLLFTLLLELAVDHITHRPDPSFNHYALATFGLKLLLLLLAGYLLTLFLRRRDGLLPMVTIFYSTLLLFALGEIAIHQFGNTLYTTNADGYTLVVYGFIAWLVVTAARAARLAFGGGRRMVLSALPLVVVVWLLPLHYGGWDNSFWLPNYPPRADRYAPYRNMDAEALLYAQPRMVGEALQQLAPQRPGVSDLYFVSFGSYAFEDVFMKEVRYAQQAMDQRFATTGRSLELVNNLQTRNSVPLASETNLRAVLNHLGGMMESEEDLLMLYLSSHGSKRHELAVDFWPLPLNDITPKKLLRMLDEAGIKWRVVVVSACYSGGFIDALRDEHTLVATAAAKDRQSFGCSNENDFTYYGEALFRDELGRGTPLLQAFRQAREAIAAREKRERLEPSLPQLFVGKRIEQKLQQLHGPAVIECGDTQQEAVTVGC